MTDVKMQSTFALSRMADEAEMLADTLHAALTRLQALRASMLLHIEELAGDRDHNWDIQADLGNAETPIHATAQKARTLSRHARWAVKEQTT